MYQNKQAFTFIELLVVVLIIGVLASAALPQYQIAVEKSRATEAFAVLKTLKSAQEVYYLANGKYATDFDELEVKIPSNGYWQYYISPCNVFAFRKSSPHYEILFPLQHTDFVVCKNEQKNIYCGYDSATSTQQIKEAMKICRALGATGTGPRMPL